MAPTFQDDFKELLESLAAKGDETVAIISVRLRRIGKGEPIECDCSISISGENDPLPGSDAMFKALMREIGDKLVGAYAAQNLAEFNLVPAPLRELH